MLNESHPMAPRHPRGDEQCFCQQEYFTFVESSTPSGSYMLTGRMPERSRRPDPLRQRCRTEQRNNIAVIERADFFSVHRRLSRRREEYARVKAAAAVAAVV